MKNRKLYKVWTVIVGLVAFLAAMPMSYAAATYDVVVAQDGSGDYTSIQDALDAVPSGLSAEYIIFIKNGTYNEKIFVEKSHVTLLGEDREKTQIVYGILRRLYLEESSNSDYGAATLNIKDYVTDLTLANLTIDNNFADENPTVESPNDHSFTIRGGSGVDKIKIVNCNIVSTGGDTLSLWNTAGGRFYHADCHFEGYVDYVCPRGYCYIEGSTFYGYNGNASIWHDGEGGEDHKLVVRGSFFDGVSGFGLGRCHRQSAFYLLDCNFSNNIKNSNITYAGDSTDGNDRDKLNYGLRAYYDNCHRLASDYDWHADNLSSAKGSPEATAINAVWTFNQTWDPVAEISGLFPFAVLPSPSNGFNGVGNGPFTMSWLPMEGATSQNVYMGTSADDLVLLGTATDSTFAFTGDTLQDLTTYYWRVDAVTADGTTEGNVWSFTTDLFSLPEAASMPTPEDGGISETPSRIKLSWAYDTLKVDKSSVYVSEQGSDLELLRTTTAGSTYVRDLEDGKTYQWRVDCENKVGVTTGEVWTFTCQTPSAVANELGNAGFVVERCYVAPGFNELSIVAEIPESGEVNVSLIDINGRIMASTDQAVKEGAWEYLWALPQGLPEGAYVAKLEYNGQIKTLLVKLP